MEWLTSFETGDLRIDEQHKLLAKMLDEYTVALSEGKGKWTYGLFLDFLDRYERTHFGLEEGCLADRHCPLNERFIESRTAFRAIVDEFQSHFSANGFDVSNATTLTKNVAGWLISHVSAVMTTLSISPLGS